MKIKFIKDWSTHKAGNNGNFEPNIVSHLIGLGVAEVATPLPVKGVEPKQIKVKETKRKWKVKVK
jgi:hypothetical protein